MGISQRNHLDGNRMKNIFIVLDLPVLQAVTCERVEAAAKLSQTIMEERSQKDIEMQQVLAQARASIPATVNLASERMDDVTMLTDGKNTYTVQFINSTEQTPVDSDHE